MLAAAPRALLFWVGLAAIVAGTEGIYKENDSLSEQDLDVRRNYRSRMLTDTFVLVWVCTSRLPPN